jgi:predicted O-methyltransferase YrrM
MMECLSYESWLKIVAHPLDVGCHGENFYNHYVTKYKLARRFGPKKIGEIGVRLGYSAHAFLSGSGFSVPYSGFDVVGGEHGGTNIAGLEYANSILKRDFPRSNISLTKVDTQSINEFPESGFDFFHVDGDHTTAGALHDMRMVWGIIKSHGIMLVDDYDYIADVKNAIDEFLKEKSGDILYKEYVKSFRGEILIIKR